MKTVGGESINPLGLGTWHLGGGFDNINGVIVKNTETSDEKEKMAVHYTLEKGCNYIDVCHHYGYGKSAELIGSVLRSHNRNDIFINAKLEDFYASKNEVKESLDNYLKVLHTDYIDCFQIHAPMHHMDHRDTIEAINELIDEGKVRYFGVSNFNKVQLHEAMNYTNHKLASHELYFNLVTRINEELGIIDFCERNDIEVIAYKPLMRNNIDSEQYLFLEELSKKYKKKVNQLLLNWIINHKKYKTITKSTNFNHIDENMASVDFMIETDDYLKMDEFRPPLYTTPEVDRDGKDMNKPRIWKI